MKQADLLKIRAEMAELNDMELDYLNHALLWRKQTSKRPEQRMPPLILPNGLPWHTWLIMAGRGFGKTRVGAECTIEWACRYPGHLIGVVAPTHDLLKDVCFEGESGLLANLPKSWIEQYNRSETVITLNNRAKIFGYSAQDPERLRGPQFHKGWLDEFAAWDYPEEALTMINMCIRLGDDTRKIVTTTPKPFKILRDMIDDKHTVTTRGSTHANKKNLSPMFLQEILKYEGTEIGRQEIHGELLDFEEAGIFKRSTFKIWPCIDTADGRRILKPVKFLYVIQSYDTAFKDKVANDPSACTTWGLFRPDPDKPNVALMLLDCWKERLQYPDLRKKAHDSYKNDVYGEKDTHVDAVLVEDKASGQSLIQDLHRTGVPVFAYNPGKADKLMRAHLASPYVNLGFIYLPESAKLERAGQPRTWVEPFLDQVCRFGPQTFDRDDEEDDYVDTLTQVIAWCRDSNMLVIPYDPVEDDSELEEVRIKNPYAA